MTTPTYRRPLLLVTANAAPLPKVFSARTVRGWDQMLAKADITVPYPPPLHLGKGSRIRISGGIASLATRFTGYVTGLGASLWPSTWTFPCEDSLWLAKNYKPSSTINLSNATDENAVRVILVTVGAPFVPDLILGTGKKIGGNASQALSWTPKETALSKIQQIDQLSTVDHGGGHLTMFRTYADFGGQIRRVEIANLPGQTAARSFVEGIDLEDGSSTVEPVEPNTIVVASGAVGITSTATVTNPWAVISNPAFVAAPMLQNQATGPTFLSTDDLVAVLAQRFSLNLIRVDFKTWREDLIGAIETVLFDSDHQGTTLRAFVQSVVTQWLEDGEFSQQVSLVSARDLNTNPNAPQQFNPFTGLPFPPLDPDLVPVPPDTVQAAFEVLYISAEVVLIADVETLIYTASCVDASTSSGGTITTRTWTAAGGASPASGSDKFFNPSWTEGEIASATVTLEVEDSLGGTDTITTPISLSMGLPVRTRDLFAAATDALEAFSGADRTWRRYTTGITGATVVANGPLWAQGDTVYRSSDFLATAPSSSVPSAGVDVVSIWTELDLDADAVAAGLANGKVAFSSDAGATWTVKDGPDEPNPVLKVILSRFTPGEVHAITATGYFSSPDAGDTWGPVRSGDYRDLDLNPFRNWAIEVAAGSGGMIEAASGSAISGATDDLVAVTSHPLADRGYALAADGSAYLLAEDGDTALTAGTAVPAGTPQARGMYRDGSAPEILYMALGAGGVYKTTDGLRATYYPLRKPGVEGAGSGPWPAIGAGLLAALAPAAGFVLYVGGKNNEIYKYDGAAWSTLTVPTSETGGAGRSWHSIATGRTNTQKILAYSAEGTGDLVLSLDGGGTWTALAGPSFAGGFSKDLITWTYVHTDGPIYIAVIGTSDAADGGIWRSDDDGATWDHVMVAGPNLDPDDGQSAQGIRHCAVTEDTRFWMWAPHATGPNTSHTVESALKIPGSPWTLDHESDVYDPDTSSLHYSIESIFPGSGAKVWIPLDDDADTDFPENYDLFEYDTSGIVRQIQFTNSADSHWLSNDKVVVDYGDGTIIVAGESNGVFPLAGDVWKSTDDAATWTRVVAASTTHRTGGFIGYGPHLVKDPGSDDLYMVTTADDGAGGRTVLKSTDRGDTWTSITGTAEVADSDGVVTCGRAS